MIEMSAHETEPLGILVLDGDDNTSKVVYDALREEYSDMASWYDQFWRPYTEVTLERPLNEALEEIDRIGRLRLVDVGCGTGAFLRRLLDVVVLRRTSCHSVGALPADLNLVGIEPSEEMLQQARKKFGQEEEQVNVVLKRSPAEHIPLGDDSVNIVVSTNAFHFFRDKDRSLREMKRVLRQDGTIIITDWCNDYWIVKLYHLLERLSYKNWGFRERYPSPLTGAEMTELIENAGFCEVEHASYRVRVFSIFYWGMQTIKATKR